MSNNLQKYRDILCVDRNASKEQIKTSYRKEAKRWHPDKNNGDDTRFKKIAEAYEKLTEVGGGNARSITEIIPNPIFRQFHRPTRGGPPQSTQNLFTQNISQENGTMSQEFINISNGVKVIHKVMSNLKTGDRTEFTFRTFT